MKHSQGHLHITMTNYLNEYQLTLPQRENKPREQGLTAITDLGMPTGKQQELLLDYGDLIDFAELGIGSVYVNPVVHKKIQLYSEYDIPVCFGGTLFEKHYYQNQLGSYMTSVSMRVDIVVKCCRQLENNG